MSQSNRPSNELEFYGREVLPLHGDCAPIAEDIIKAHRAGLNAVQFIPRDDKSITWQRIAP